MNVEARVKVFLDKDTKEQLIEDSFLSPELIIKKLEHTYCDLRNRTHPYWELDRTNMVWVEDEGYYHGKDWYKNHPLNEDDLLFIESLKNLDKLFKKLER